MLSARAGGRAAAQRLTSLLANVSFARPQPSRPLHAFPVAAAARPRFAPISLARPALPLAFPQRSLHAASLRAASTIASTARAAQAPAAASPPPLATGSPVSQSRMQPTTATQCAPSGTQPGRKVATVVRRGAACSAGQPRRLSGRFPPSPSGLKQWLGLAVSIVVAVGALVLFFSIGMAFLAVLAGVFAVAALYGAIRTSRFGGASPLQ
ncbi:hypothetical protein T484DRAFT_1810098 [Baffinella frigidus]|nr:hypothetical protein T484DRAFT_1810098 [Cryptophyta sp. CCMP2293]